MSIAEFYIDNCIDPSDPNHMDDFLRRQRDESWYGGGDEDEDQDSLPGQPNVEFSGVSLDMYDEDNHQQQQQQQQHALDEHRLDILANQYGYSKLDTSSSTAPMASYRRGACRLNFWLTTGTVGSYLDHPRQGKTQLFRRDVNLNEADTIFQNPRIHTGRGYSNNDRTNGSRGSCRFGENCYRVDCWFDH